MFLLFSRWFRIFFFFFCYLISFVSINIYETTWNTTQKNYWIRGNITKTRVSSTTYDSLLNEMWVHRDGTWQMREIYLALFDVCERRFFVSYLYIIYSVFSCFSMLYVYVYVWEWICTFCLHRLVYGMYERWICR